ncbi:hypothetical protein AN639_08420 [Candidatus Epulonipiscium fishelsonii]|uniref:Uncharacterized protein n=1 Tax=Candidatus Epulonipiscium fishelsonii TaxID=77094 RepID=A0ACC8XGD7_9FIRM|nr:hypothetical protein AN639_08420 [Epulopiscium sp. SCG-B05WGA-EpuloA1]ONI42482.1 hypothetical protein AN396_14205 [Epulopiscium sp. SCG-B11WGA-EpuloA1]
MNCENYSEMLSCYIDNELTQEEKLELEHHLSTCKNCNQQLQDLMSIKESMTGLETYQVPLDFHSELMKKINPRKKQKPKPKYLYYMGLAASIAVGFFIYDGIIPNNDVAQPQPASLAQKLPDTPVADIPIPETSETTGTNNIARSMPIKFNGMEIDLFQADATVITDLINFADEQNLSYIDLSEPTRLYWVINSVEDYNVLREYINSMEYLQKFGGIMQLDEVVNPNEDIKIIVYRNPENYDKP